ncbi:DgaE family pyridoxal phosphate-dependent ammonia lyase [Lacticaseibacillus casei]|uniref:DgaE family pyridoxal phosphate-dependent ammonia lyase n=1 Tax=Lacticaseibacillus huelsenbergensis TaxID=3035291 RepID=A0ABY8DSU3_9LACO|nr:MULTISPECIES: DgaE family pyridoxal phosphate-dependent ammonia lyase [Lacticaseibacillus]MDG3062819.1 DgaE family pyridoxal phosphate-dependent ammonia lyase [Lacticaseibacillus sp. BCRC 81376]QVI36670.1 DgaE family pyridoxal phosphate-dependent ammonia lyase [Lacticaseibacillus casei]QXG58461.1 DgaE family pyridoxal phosphate-dependent ammonia lyase [Lacticaseibacillus casei]WFB40069.1 DgaE family pyridoxal phosphate-dependent ammonia lyase [Lacticaseibacillus huelsenbergensis]WFB41802.1 
MTDYYSTYDLKHVINASGKMTILGVSKVPEAAIQAQQFGDTHFFEMKDLTDKTGAFIAKKLGTEGALVVNSASAGIAEAVAGIIGRGSKYHAYHPFSPRYTKREIILPKGQNVDYGTPEEVMIELGGGQVVEAGYANMCTPEHVEMMINENTAAIFYVKSHHAVQKSMLTIQEALEVAHKHELPLILDAAAEEDLKKYVDMGVDVVLFSGAKAIEGPASGLVFGKEPYISWTKLQGLGIGRAMKIGKENILGFTTALVQYLDHGPESGEAMKARLHPFVAALNDVPHLNVKEVQDGAGRPIFRAAVTVEASSPKDAKQVTAELKAGNPAIYTREYRANEGIIEFDIRAVDQAEMDLIVHRLKEILA